MATIHKYTLEERQSHVSAWRSGTLSRKEYCRREHIKYSTFKNWTAQFKVATEGFIPLTVRDKISGGVSQCFRVKYPNGVELECPAGISAEQVVELIKGY